MKSFLILCMLLFSIFTCFSQNGEFPKQQKSIFIYTIENIKNQQQLDKLKAEVEQVKGVSEVKIIFKWENQKGQLTFTYSEEISGSENKENIDLAVFKNIIINNDLEFVDFKVK